MKDSQMDSQIDDQPEEKEGLLMFLAALVLGTIAVMQGLCSRKKKIWHKIVPLEDGAAFVIKKAKKHRITMTAWKIWSGDGSKRYTAVFLVHRGEYTWCLYGEREHWDLTNDKDIANRLWAQFGAFLSREECKQFLLHL